MAITRKPKTSIPSIGNVDIDALINKGGSTPQEDAAEIKDGTTAVVLRLPTEMLKQIDRAVKARPIKTPRHTWLLEAIYEKLSRTSKDHGEA